MAMWWIYAPAMIGLVLWLLCNAFRGPARINESAEDVLKRHLSDGYIDIDEYERRLAALSQTKTAA
jgi:hypothetical protein